MGKQFDNQAGTDIKKLGVLLPHWVSHNDQHIEDKEKWLVRTKELGLEGVAEELEAAIRLLREANAHIQSAEKKLEEAGGATAPSTE